ncbi:hypothetical protein DPMN_008157 [Dreissena polymorpha]|uniref:Uncharacterized protein n=1 Tax=Dreissena polymorpha TaxID=45954 RepID=A0A9D4MYQ2_DREPO|nr:hypothetical protein DPMN_008157 [Dreissena polymorpha]
MKGGKPGRDRRIATEGRTDFEEENKQREERGKVWEGKDREMRLEENKLREKRRKTKEYKELHRVLFILQTLRVWFGIKQKVMLWNGIQTEDRTFLLWYGIPKVKISNAKLD